MAGKRRELAGSLGTFLRFTVPAGLPAGCEVARLKFSARLRRLGSVNGLNVPLFLVFRHLSWVELSNVSVWFWNFGRQKVQFEFLKRGSELQIMHFFFRKQKYLFIRLFLSSFRKCQVSVFACNNTFTLF
jgi:hypothetical protein